VACDDALDEKVRSWLLAANRGVPDSAAPVRAAAAVPSDEQAIMAP